MIVRYVMKEQFFSLGGTFHVADGEDDVLILASAVVIDMVRADSDK